MKKILSLLLVFAFTVPLLFSCAKNGGSAEESEDGNFEGIKFSVLPDKTALEAALINTQPRSDAIVVYTRDYKISKKPSVVIGLKQTGRVAVSVVLNKDKNGNDEFSIVSRTEEVEKAPIPVNGFAVSIPKEMIENIRVNVGQLVKVEGYEKLGIKYERLDLASFAPSSMTGAFSRRVSVKDPVGGIKDNMITFLTGEKEYDIPLHAFVANLYQVSKYGYNVVSASVAARPVKGSPSLVFTGEYNVAYAEKFIKEKEKLMFSNIEEANCYSDVPCLLIGSEIFEMTDDRVNTDNISEKGVYMFTSEYDGVTPPDTSDDRCDVVLVNDSVAMITENGQKAMIPSSNGVVFTFVGSEYVKKAADFSLGEKLDTVLVEYKKVPVK